MLAGSFATAADDRTAMWTVSLVPQREFCVDATAYGTARRRSLTRLGRNEPVALWALTRFGADKIPAKRASVVVKAPQQVTLLLLSLVAVQADCGTMNDCRG